MRKENKFISMQHDINSFAAVIITTCTMVP